MHFLFSLLLGVAIATAALLSVQNASAVTVKFLLWQSIPLPFGIVLAFTVSGGILLVALLRPGRGLAASSTSTPEFDLDEFDTEDWE